jgi:hypothetical protein
VRAPKDIRILVPRRLNSEPERTPKMEKVALREIVKRNSQLG